MPNLLRKLVIREISVVDKGASGDAANRPRVVLYKRDGAATGQPFGFSLQVSKVDAEQGLVTGWASVISLEVARIEKRKSEIAKVAGEFAHVPGDIAKRTERLFGIREKLGEEAYSEAVEEYRQSEALAKKALRERGTTGAADEGSAEAKINELAKGLVSKASGKDHLSFEQAFAKICSENPELYRQMRDEQRAN